MPFMSLLWLSWIAVYCFRTGISMKSRVAAKVAAEDNIPTYELQALNDLYEATRGTDWIWGQQPGVPWNFTTGANPCLDDWEGLTCTSALTDGYLHVNELSLPSYNLTGFLPSSIGNLSALLNMSLYNNHLSGAVLTDSIGQLTSLRFLDMDFCHLRGTLPAAMGNMSSLQSISMNGNGLTGTIPDSLCNWQQIEYLSLNGEVDLYGTLPECMGNLTTLKHLDLSNNNLTGTLPTSFAKLARLEYLTLGFNIFHGTVPDAYRALVQLQTLEVTGNILTGPFPDALTALVNLKTLLIDLNEFTGTVPASIGFLTDLRLLDLEHNSFNGTLPATLTQLTKLQELVLAGNFFTGTLPEGFRGLNQLQILSVYSNQLSGTLPAELVLLGHVMELLLSSNAFTGTLPDAFPYASPLLIVQVNSNQLSGTVPASLMNTHLLSTLVVASNKFTGPFASIQSTNVSNLFYVNAANNFLTGTVPSFAPRSPILAYLNFSNNYLSSALPASFGNLTSLDFCYFYRNLLTGTIPDIWHNLTGLSFLVVSDNLLTGRIPVTLGDAVLLQSLNVSNNFLSGSLPTSLSQLSKLRVLLLMNNALTGHLDGVLNATRQHELATLQLSNNQLSGTLPDYISQLPLLNVFAAVSNCFTGSIPQSLCESASLITLALDGLQTATSCQRRLFSSALEGTIVAEGLYSIRSPLTGGVPACLFSMRNLTTLHLSGNGLTGSIPDNLTVSATLVDMSLSHNKLTGTIPAALLGRDWSNLDLSYNRLAGSLTSSVRSRYSNTTALSLNNNRLSGEIPGSFRDLSGVDVLLSNLFSCNDDRSDLPRNDHDRDKYSCASVTFDGTVFAWIAVIGAGAAVIAVIGFAGKWTAGVRAELRGHLQRWWHAVSSQTPSIVAAHRSAQTIGKLSVAAAAYIVLVLLPIYAVCSALYGTYTHQYAYAISAAYLSGPVPFAWEFVFLLLLLAAVGLLARYLLADGDEGALLEAAVTSPALVQPTVGKRLAVFAFVLTLNFAVVLGANTAYIIIALNENGKALLLAQFAMALFKVAFNALCSPALLRRSSLRFLGRLPAPRYFIAVQLLVSIVNNILVPCLVVSIISPDCFYNVFKTAANVNADFTYDGECLFYQAYEALQFACAQTKLAVARTSYSPPFDYSYQCSSSFITYYAPAYVIMCIIAGFALPVAQVVLQRLHSRALVGTRWFAVLDTVLPRILKPEVEETEAGSQRILPLFDAPQHLVTLLTYLALLMTFGAVFPPLAVCFSVSILCMGISTRLKVGRFLVNAREANLPGQVAIVEQECAGVGEPGILLRAVCIIAVCGGVFYTLFLFDTLGDERGLSGAYWVLIVTPLVVPAVLCSTLTWRKCRTRNDGTLKGRVPSLMEMPSVDLTISPLSGNQAP